MKIIDTHVHIGAYGKIKYIVENSQYKEKYRLYSAIEPKILNQIDNYLEQCESIFAMPMVLKELDIAEENKYVLQFCKICSKAIPVLLVDDEIKIYEENNIHILKEHFLYHNSAEWINRKTSYEYLNSIDGFLIIHSSDTERIDYIKLLMKNFPRINIIIAHMGRNVFEEYDFTISVINEFKNNPKIYFDISTISNAQILSYAVQQISSTRILFASDFPYEFKFEISVERLIKNLNILNLPNEIKDNIFYHNAKKIIEHIYM